MLKELGAMAQFVANQLTPSEKKVVFSPKCKAVMEKEGFKEEDALDVFYKGTEVRKQMIRREYYSRTLILFYFRNSRTGDYVITWFGKENPQKRQRQ